MPVYLLATLDTKGIEAAFVREQLQRQGIDVVLVDVGCQGEPAVPADIPRAAVFQAAGADLHAVQAAGDRGQAVTLAAAGAARLVQSHYEPSPGDSQVQGVLGLGGSAGTTIATAAMRALPIGVPKLMVSTLASGQVRQYVGDKDILMLNSIVDLAGVNRISRRILANAAAAMAGMAVAQRNARDTSEAPNVDKPLVAATMFGVTTPCVEQARRVLEAAGYEVLVFHATGSGGQALETLIDEGLLAGVLDITTTELADELVGGVLTAGPQRLTAAARTGTPQVASVGALDMVNFHAPETIPERFRDRRFYRHNASVTLMRTTAEENRRLGQEIAQKVGASRGPAAILLPRRGVSAIDRAGQPFDDPEARGALFTALQTGLQSAARPASAAPIEVEELDLHINDEAFATAAANKLLELMRGR